MADGTVSSLCDEAREHLKNLRVDEGENAARQALALDPNSDDALTLLGIALCRKGRITDGIEALGQAVSLNPNNVTARSNLATARHQAGHLEAARAEWLMVLGLDPDNTKARGALAVVEWQMQQAAAQPPDATQPVAPRTEMPGPGPTAQPQAIRYDLSGNPVATPGSSEPQPVQGASLGQPAAPTIHYPQAAPVRGARGGPSGAGWVGAGSSSNDDPGKWSLAAIMAVITSPTEFMASQRGHYSIAVPFVFDLINALIVGAAAALFSALRMIPILRSSEMGDSGLAVGAGVVAGILGMVIGILAGVLGRFVGAAIVHLLAALFGGTAPFGGTYRVLVLASVPGYVAYVLALGLMMVHPMLAILGGIIGIAGAIWTIVVAIIGLGQVHDLSGCASFGALFLSGVAMVALMLLLSLALGGVMQTLLGASRYQRPGRTMPFGGPPGIDRPFSPSNGLPGGP